MALQFTIPKQINPQVFKVELNAALGAAVPHTIKQSVGADTIITVDTDEINAATVSSVIDLHDHTVLSDNEKLQARSAELQAEIDSFGPALREFLKMDRATQAQAVSDEYTANPDACVRKLSDAIWAIKVLVLFNYMALFELEDGDL